MRTTWCRRENARHVQFHLLSFVGPDGYGRAGGIASRVTGLAQALAEAGFATHLWFVGGPDLPGHEAHDGAALQMAGDRGAHPDAPVALLGNMRILSQRQHARAERTPGVRWVGCDIQKEAEVVVWQWLYGIRDPPLRGDAKVRRVRYALR